MLSEVLRLNLSQQGEVTPFHLSKEYKRASESLRFHDLAPEMTAVVYHITEASNLPKIAGIGLEKTRISRYEEWLDSFRDSDDKPLIARSAYAQPTGGYLINMAHGLYRGFPKVNAASEAQPEMLEIAVDPDKAYVFPGQIGEFAREMIGSGNGDYFANLYWGMAMPFRKFEELYKLETSFSKDGNPDFKWILKDMAVSDGLPRPHYTAPGEYDAFPEILIPTQDGVIPSNQIQHSASSTINRVIRGDELVVDMMGGIDLSNHGQ